MVLYDEYLVVAGCFGSIFAVFFFFRLGIEGNVLLFCLFIFLLCRLSDFVWSVSSYLGGDLYGERSALSQCALAGDRSVV